MVIYEIFIERNLGLSAKFPSTLKCKIFAEEYDYFQGNSNTSVVSSRLLNSVMKKQSKTN